MTGALVGVAVGAVIGFGLTQFEGWLRRARQARIAARLIPWELASSLQLARVFLEHGPGESPITPRSAAWDNHSAALVNITDEDTLGTLAIAYGMVSFLGRLEEDYRRGDTRAGPMWSETLNTGSASKTRCVALSHMAADRA